MLVTCNERFLNLYNYEKVIYIYIYIYIYITFYVHLGSIGIHKLRTSELFISVEMKFKGLNTRVG
jgi:hypothetical protein